MTGTGEPDATATQEATEHLSHESDDRVHVSVPVTMSDGVEVVLDHGHVAIAVITSCTNTSNPSVMLAAGLLAKKAVEKGLARKPWVKTSLAPGSRVVVDYYEAAGLTPYLEALGFNLVGFGCTTCIGNGAPSILQCRLPWLSGSLWSRCCPETATSKVESTPTFG